MWKNIDELAIIPKEFSIAGNRKYNVVFVDNAEEMNGNLGDFNDFTREIRIAKGTNDCRLDNEDLLRAYLHELGHCITYNYNCECPEEFAQMFSNFMYEYLHTKVKNEENC